MIYELRELTFTEAALKDAFRWYQSAPNQKDCPHGAIASVKPQPGGGVMVLLQQAGASKMREVAFTSSRLLMVLLYFCRKQKIPIPREAEKTLSSDEAGIILTIGYQFRSVAPGTQI
jgi:hypothetical protein